jgi:murein L,D-transpeptidase YafK
MAAVLGWIAAATGQPCPEGRPMGPTVAIEHPRLVLLKSQRSLHLFDGDRLIRVYPVDLGLSPIGDKRCDADCRTPEGRFHICSKNSASPYHRFLGLDYPGESAVIAGLASGLISSGEAIAIRRALANGGAPKWDSALGGGVGLHGHRRGSDWTAGCIALGDDDIEELFGVLRVGDAVEILP